MLFCEIGKPDGSAFVGIGERKAFRATSELDWTELEAFLETTKHDFKFISLSYELKSNIHPLKANSDELVFPQLLIWTPAVLLEKRNGEYFEVAVHHDEGSTIDWRQFINTQLLEHPLDQLLWESCISKEEYLQRVTRVKREIQLGNVYELNFCQNFKAKTHQPFSAYASYLKLQKHNPTPFSCFFEDEHTAIISASPERYLAKSGTQVYSQPIKGTAPRSQDVAEDQANKQRLQNSVKERSENVMIVDLVRNDLSRIALKNSVKVDELCKIYSFPTVHQMISTISCQVSEQVSFSELIKASFPMGSMTGAPKLAAIKIAEQLEGFKREMFSGSMGYMLPNGDFDLNVLIRSLFIHKDKDEVHCPVGGAITILSDPELEYEECITKVGKILSLFGTCRFN